MFGWELRKAGVLGMNRRNLDYVYRWNQRKHFRLVDDKLTTKQLMQAHNLPTPQLYGSFERHGDVSRLGALLQKHPHCVLKPSNGGQGSGIILLNGQADENHFFYRKDQRIAISALQRHAYDILCGMYALDKGDDALIVEYKSIPSQEFRELCGLGVPDVRIVVYRTRPVMAMLRLPTSRSDGKANLHMGGIGVGVDMEAGVTTFAKLGKREVTHHPDTGAPLIGYAIPCWRDMLWIATRFAEVSGLGYLGVDIILDSQHGPMILEGNARPGLAIQLANRKGLLPALQKVDAELGKA